MIGETIYIAIYIRFYLHTKYSSGTSFVSAEHKLCVYSMCPRLAVPTPTPICIACLLSSASSLLLLSSVLEVKGSFFISSAASLTECRCFQSCGFKFERESGRDTSLEHRELVLAFEDMITTFTTTLYFRYGDVTVPRHCGKCFYDILTSHTRLVSSFFSSFVNIKRG